MQQSDSCKTKQEDQPRSRQGGKKELTQELHVAEDVVELWRELKVCNNYKKYQYVVSHQAVLISMYVKKFKVSLVSPVVVLKLR